MLGILSELHVAHGRRTPIPQKSEIFAETKIIKDELYVKGDICVYDEWFATGDVVKFHNERYWYYGRQSS